MSDDRKKRIVELVARFPEGAAISDLEEELDLHRRTIQRYLKKLVQEDKLRRTGRGPSTRYFVPTPPIEDAPLPSQPIFSTEAKAARRKIREPLTRRHPISYQKSFLESYTPGQTYYLSHQTRAELRQVGALTEEGLPAGTYARRILDRLLIDSGPPSFP